MTSLEAKRILSIYRPGIDEQDPDVREALLVVEKDVELRDWLNQHKRFQTSVQDKFQEIPVPTGLRERILSEQKIVRPEFRSRRRLLIGIAALVIAFIGLSIVFRPGGADRFADYESRMVRGALREYRMDVVSSDLARVRLAMASRGAPSEFPLPKGLTKLAVVGGGALKWRNNPVTMVCFDRGDKQMLFLFVLNRSAVKGAPAKDPSTGRVSRLQTASWTEGDNVYVLAGPEEQNFAQKYL
jgi:hypothetical protein